MQDEEEARRGEKKPVLRKPTEAMKLQDPVAADEVAKIIAKIKAGEQHYAQVLGRISMLKEKRRSVWQRLERAESQKAVYEERVSVSWGLYVNKFNALPAGKEEAVRKRVVEQQHLDVLRECRQRREEDIGK
jgi:hypothetical protein